MVEERGREGLGCRLELPGSVVKETPAGSKESKEEEEEEDEVEEEGFLCDLGSSPGELTTVHTVVNASRFSTRTKGEKAGVRLSALSRLQEEMYLRRISGSAGSRGSTCCCLRRLARPLQGEALVFLARPRVRRFRLE
jgi:hypothetical protein